ncbi:hypothetical protein COW81_00980 [Candidatus Campbellbacteria bacterium CG22_combo_CG10-13_8_21_14_all_36_13]|uniref:Uncharacterized protein n=1 Tax=Candidatus Campbellbacteria bacterium CG22_combo_CG10-13_8_21_14_all_36_13 TaxID=1974529 RepID=A0A2H0DYM3_9BACT|nr:MAG: hypothetical protein COW81_00980 [Candidatus Campbellbacteria bacterium CG22_combo_CG10-13_8_21_14_all_36_13]
MSVEFGEKRSNQFLYTNNHPTGISGWLINKGFVSDNKSANKILIIIIGVILVIIFVILLLSFGGDKLPPETYLPAEI